MPDDMFGSFVNVQLDLFLLDPRSVSCVQKTILKMLSMAEDEDTKAAARSGMLKDMAAHKLYRLLLHAARHEVVSSLLTLSGSEV